MEDRRHSTVWHGTARRGGVQSENKRKQIKQKQGSVRYDRDGAGLGSVAKYALLKGRLVFELSKYRIDDGG